MPQKPTKTDTKALEVRQETVGHRIAALVTGLGDRYSLTLPQKAFLMVRWRYKTDAEAARALNLSAKTVYRWQQDIVYADGRKASAFPEAYREFFRGFDAVIQGEIEGLLGKVVGRIDEMLDAEKVWVGQGGVEVRAPDHEARFKGIQAVLHYLGKWGARNPTEINNVYVNPSEDFAALLKQKQKDRAKTLEGAYEVVSDDQ